MRSRVLVAAALVALVWCGIPVWAGKGDMRAQFGIPYNMPTDDLAEPGERVQLDDAFGFQASFEYMVTDKIGVEPALSFTNHDVEVTSAAVPDFDLGEIGYFAVMSNVNFHVVQEDKMELYVGPTIGIIFWDDLETDLFGTTETFAADDDFAYGANIGLGIPFGKGKWGFTAGLTWLFTDITLESEFGTAAEPDLGVDPMRLNVGVSYKF